MWWSLEKGGEEGGGQEGEEEEGKGKKGERGRIAHPLFRQLSLWCARVEQRIYPITNHHSIGISCLLCVCVCVCVCVWVCVCVCART